jgi:hypothetical protein
MCNTGNSNTRIALAKGRVNTVLLKFKKGALAAGPLEHYLLKQALTKSQLMSFSITAER